MSFEHKYLKYKQKYLELKKELSKYQVGGATNIETETSDSLNVEKLTETPTFEKVFGMKKDDLTTFNFNEKEEDIVMVESETGELENEVEVEQHGGEADLDTSISELDEIFSQLGGKKKSKDEDDEDIDSDSSDELSSLSELEEDSSSDFEF